MLSNLESLLHNYQRLGWIIRKIRFDARNVENSRDVSLYLVSKSILAEPAAVEHQNGNPVERSIQTLFNHVSTILDDQPHLSLAWWGYAFLSHIKAIHCTSNSHLRDGYAPERLNNVLLISINNFDFLLDNL